MPDIRVIEKKKVWSSLLIYQMMLVSRHWKKLRIPRLEADLEHLWKKKSVVIPIVFKALGVISKGFP